MHIDNHVNPASKPDQYGRVRRLPCRKPQMAAHSPAGLSVGRQRTRSCRLPPQMEGRSPHRWRHRWHSAPQRAAGGPCTGYDSRRAKCWSRVATRANSQVCRHNEHSCLQLMPNLATYHQKDRTAGWMLFYSQHLPT